MKTIITLLIAALMVGCATPQKIPTSPPKAEIPASLLVKCPELEKLKDNSLGSLYNHDIELMQQYIECATRHDRLIDAVK